MSRVAVIGAGSWGTAVSCLVAQNADEVVLWSHGQGSADAINQTHHNPRYLADVELPANVHATSDLAGAALGCSAVVLAAPSTHLRNMSRDLAASLGPDVAVLVLTKGIEAGTGLLMSEVAAAELGGEQRVAALSGPNHAEEVSLKMFSAAVLASPSEKIGEQLRDYVATPTFRVYLSDDLRGVETCGAVKNVIAIAVGVAYGLGYGDNTAAMLMTRGLAEMSRLTVKCGGQAITCMGLAGAGDLIATCTSEHSRNRSFGVELAQGGTLDGYRERTHMVVEGALACKTLKTLSEAYNVELPITDVVRGVVWEGADPKAAAKDLFARPLTTEFYGL